MNLFGKITSGLAVAALAGCAVPGSATAPARAAADGNWPAHTVLKLTSPVFVAAVDPAADAAYAMAGADDGPFRLERVDLATDAVKTGPSFPVAGLLPAAGYLWIYGRQSYPRSLATLVLYQVSPSTLTRVRTWVIAPRSLQGLTVTAGPGRSGTCHPAQDGAYGLGGSHETSVVQARPPSVVESSRGPQPSGGHLFWVSGWLISKKPVVSLTNDADTTPLMSSLTIGAASAAQVNPPSLVAARPARSAQSQPWPSASRCIPGR
jgi:hypothetical protein